MADLQTSRLTLVSMSLDLVIAAIDDRTELERLLSARISSDWPQVDFAEILPWVADRLREDPGLAPWTSLVIHTQDRIVIGEMGFKGAPDAAGMIEMGYSIVPSYQGQGYGSEAAQALVDWAFRQPGVRQVTAECLQENVGSIRVLEKLRMQRLGLVEGMLKWELNG